MKNMLICAAALFACGACGQGAANGAAAAEAAAPANATAAAPPAPPAAPSISPLDYLRGQLGAGAGTNVATAEADLNGDGMNELIVYVSGPEHCGSGGCRVVALTADRGAWRTVMDASVSRLPIRLLESSSNGWRDLGVTTGGGGGAAPGLARMRFDGTAYPDNPTAPPAEAAGADDGTVLIAEDAQSGPLL